MPEWGIILIHSILAQRRRAPNASWAARTATGWQSCRPPRCGSRYTRLGCKIDVGMRLGVQFGFAMTVSACSLLRCVILPFGQPSPNGRTRFHRTGSTRCGSYRCQYAPRQTYDPDTEVITHLWGSTEL